MFSSLRLNSASLALSSSCSPLFLPIRSFSLLKYYSTCLLSCTPTTSNSWIFSRQVLSSSSRFYSVCDLLSRVSDNCLSSSCSCVFLLLSIWIWVSFSYKCSFYSSDSACSFITCTYCVVILSSTTLKSLILSLYLSSSSPISFLSCWFSALTSFI